MRFKKLFLILFMIFIGLTFVSAADDGERLIDISNNLFPNYQKLYKIIAAEEYYDANAVSFRGQRSDRELVSIWDEAIRKFELVDIIDSGTLAALYDTHTSAESFARMSMEKAGLETISEENSNFLTEMAEKTTLLELLQLCRNKLRNLSVEYKNIAERSGDLSNSELLVNEFEETVDIIDSHFTDLCDFIEKNQGVKYYIERILKILGYVALALAVILGALDFIKAISSNDDAALKKAFQSFVRRLIAVALVFLTYVIVQIIISLVPTIPNYGANNALCESFRTGFGG